MLRSLFNLILSGALLGATFLLPHSLFDVSLEQPGPAQAASLPAVPENAMSIAPVAIEPSAAQPEEPQRDPLGEVYFTITGFDPAAYRLVRLPGSCVVGLQACPEPDVISTPFEMKDVYTSKAAGMAWSPDGKTGALVVHPEDELMRGRTQEEMAVLQGQDAIDLQVSPSTIFLFDAETESWKELYRAERKYITNLAWSPDGQWLAFAVRNSVWGFHSLVADDGIYVVHPDGSDLRQLAVLEGYPLGWIGNSIAVQHNTVPYPAVNYAVVMLTLESEVKPLFESERIAFYNLAPDGSALLASDARSASFQTPQKVVDLLALDGSIMRSYGSFSNANASIWVTAWSDDGVQIAFSSLRRVYVAARGGDVREVYTADDTFVEPSIWQMQFSPDAQHLLLDIYDGTPKFVSVSLESGDSTELTWPGMTGDDQTVNFSWRP